MSFTKRIWTDPIKLDASNINRLEQGIKNSFDNIEIMKEEVLSLQLNSAKLNSKVNSLLSDSPEVLKIITDITTILNSNTSILDTLKDTSNFLTKTSQTLTLDEIKQVQKNLGINKFLHLTDIKLNDISIVNGSEINITIPKPDTELSATSSNALANSVVYQSLKNLSKSIKYSDIIDAPSYKDIASNHNHDGIYALLKHYHSEYAISNHNHDTKYANIVHDHNNIYSLQNHTHNNYASLLHTHANYAHVIHDHDMDYATVSHTHTESQIIDLQNYALLNHTHDNRYPSLSHTHTDYATINHTHSDMLIEIERLKEELEDTIDSIDKNTNFVTKDYVDKNGGKIDKILINGVVLPITNKSIDITIPTTLDQLQNTPGFISETESKEYTDYAIAQLINGAPGTLDTLKELAIAIEDNKDIITTLNSAITTKANKVHTHTESEITDLKSYALSTHKHTEKDITDLKDYSLVGHTHKESEISDLKNYALKSHTHLSTDISNLDAVLSSYALATHNHNDLYSLLNHTHTESEITDLKNYALKAHTHAISDITNLSTQLNNTLSTAKSYTDTEIETINASFTEAINTHTHTESEITDFGSYLPTAGGTLSGTVTMTAGDFLARYVGVAAAGHETNTYDKIAILSNTTNGYIRYRTKAELKSDLEVPTDYAKKAEGVYFVDGTGNTTAGTWEGTNDRITDYYDGLTVNFKIGIAGANPTTLNINGLGAKTCYLRGTSKVTTHYAVGTMVLFTYNATTDAFYSSDYDSNTSVTQTVRTTNGNFPLLLRGTSAGTTTTTTTTTFGTKMTANPSTGNLSATTFTEGGKLLSNKYAPITHTHDYAASTHTHTKSQITDFDHTHDYLPLSGGNLSGHVYLTGAQANSSTGNTSQIIFGTSDNNHLALTSNKGALVLNPSTTSTTGQIVLYTGTGTSKIPGSLDVSYTATASNINVNASGTITLGGTNNSTGAKIKWNTVNSKTPYIGYATDQTDGTFVISSLLGTNYASGLAIGGGSGNLLWKGVKVATISDIPSIPTNHVTTDTTQTISGAKTFTGTTIVPDVTIS